MARPSSSIVGLSVSTLGVAVILASAAWKLRARTSTPAPPDAAVSASTPALEPSVPPAAPPAALELSGRLAHPDYRQLRQRRHFVLRRSPVPVCELTDDLTAVRCTDLPDSYDVKDKEDWDVWVTFPDLLDGAAGYSIYEPAKGHWRLARSGEGPGALEIESTGRPDASVSREGGLALVRPLDTPEADWVVLRRGADGTAAPGLPSVVRAGARRDLSPLLTGRWLIYRDARGLGARRVLPASEPIGEPLHLLDGGAAFEWSGACGSERDTLVVAGRGEEATVLFEHDGAWTHVETGPGPFHGTPSPMFPHSARLDCRTGEAALSWLQMTAPKVGEHQSIVLHTIRCTPEGCARWESPPIRVSGAGPATMSDRLWHKVLVEAKMAVVGGRILLVSSTDRGLQARIADAAELGSAPDRLISLDASPLDDTQIITRGAAAVVLFRIGKDRTGAVRIDRSGAIQPVTETR